MNDNILSIIQEHTGAKSILKQELIQSLWSGYGELLKVHLSGGNRDSIIVKHVQLGNASGHPRGWATDIGHQRKVKSYEVETQFYAQHAHRCKARLPLCIHAEQLSESEVILLLEDLDAAGYPHRRSSLSAKEFDACLQWLAQFHASFIGQEPAGLWPIGTYWHLDTRPQELEALDDKKLKRAAKPIDGLLNDCQYKTLVHGDAKVANFCFSSQGEVAGVDFQYVGGGCGMKDLAYFVGSCLPEEECERRESQILDAYFGYLQAALDQPHPALEEEWRNLYHVAWADFHRFLKGWSPGHWKINDYSERVAQEVCTRVLG